MTGSSVPRVAVIGGGIMGAGIAVVARVAGFPVAIVESDERFVVGARERVEDYEVGRKSGRGFYDYP